MRVPALLLALALAVAASSCAAASVDGVHDDGGGMVWAELASSRRAEALPEALSGRADLFFRAADSDQDRLLSRSDVRSRPELVERHMGVPMASFLVFMESADADKDGMLSRQELHDGLAAGIAASEAPLSDPAFAGESLLETRSSSKNTRGVTLKGVVDSLGHAVKRGLKYLLGGKKPGSVSAVHPDDSCVMCQYILERCQSNLRSANLAMAQGPAFLETEAQVSSKDVYDTAARSVIESTRVATRVQRQVEREHYNNIYRIVDVTLDDVCEQGMPSDYYGYCKQVYQTQTDVVDGLRYQYRPQDICFRIGMCKKNSYIAQGIHTRYRQ